MDIWKECFEGLSKEEEFCASMCESIIAYGSGLGNRSDEQYLKSYRVSLGNNRVDEIYNKLKAYIDENYELHIGVYTDFEGCTYNAFVKKQ